MENPFDATAPMLGYLFQCRLALADAVRRLKRDGSFSVSIETMDDVVFETNGSPIELLQAKHHLNGLMNLTDASSDLWKTLRVWVDGQVSGRWATDTLHYLVTTGTARKGSIAFYLRSDASRDVLKARERLDSVAQSSENGDNSTAYSVYQSLPPAERLALLERIVVVDRHPDISGLENALKEELALTVEREFVDGLIIRLEGWWFRRVVRHLRREDEKPILSEELDAELDHLRDQFRADNLPIDSDLANVEIDEGAFASHIFVEQLRLIDIASKRILTAMRQFFRAFEQRSRWIREGFLLAGELDSYDERLVEEWELRYDAMVDDLGKDAVESAMKQAARELYGWAEREASLSIRPACIEPFVIRGSLQLLADRARVGWHPQFSERLRHLLSQKAS